MGRRAVRQATEVGAADAPRERRVRDGAAQLARPVSTGNLLADCERWCRDHLPRRDTHASSPEAAHRRTTTRGRP